MVCDRGSGMNTIPVTPAELALLLGFEMPDTVTVTDHSALIIEREVETALLRMPRMRYDYQHLAGATDVHTYTLIMERDADTAYWDDMAMNYHTKYDIATYLEGAYGWDRQRLWKKKTAYVGRRSCSGRVALGSVLCSASRCCSSLSCSCAKSRRGRPWQGPWRSRSCSRPRAGLRRALRSNRLVCCVCAVCAVPGNLCARCGDCVTSYVHA